MLEQDMIVRRRPQLRRSEYDRMVELGMFADERVELLFGELVEMSPQGAWHRWVAKELGRLLTLRLEGRAMVQIHSPIVGAEDSEPEPDVSVYPTDEESANALPSRVLLVIEVSDSSRLKDLGPKARLYALSGIPTYWVFDRERRSVRVHARPAAGEYQEITTLAAGAGARLTVPEFPDVALPVDPFFAE